jgi:hypothetical protein
MLTCVIGLLAILTRGESMRTSDWLVCLLYDTAW